MSFVQPEVLSRLQRNTANIRNVCILAHVDHGKTTLTDFLLSSNGVISSKIAGKVRFLDSRPDEQERLITMKASSIALVYKPPTVPAWALPREQPNVYDLTTPITDPSCTVTEGTVVTTPLTVESQSNPNPAFAEWSESYRASDAAKMTPPSLAPEQIGSVKVQGGHYIVNVIDSPGHVDFSSEVSAAVRVSDGAFVVVDVVEGFSIQTQAVLQQAWREGVTPCLILNKMDRLVWELKLTPYEAYEHCCRVIEHVNAAVASFHVAEAFQDSEEQNDKEEEIKGDREAESSDDEDEEPEKTDKKEKKDKKDKKDKADKAGKTEKAAKVDKAEKAEKAEKASKADKADKADKAEKADKKEKKDKKDKTEKAEKPVKTKADATDEKTEEKDAKKAAKPKSEKPDKPTKALKGLTSKYSVDLDDTTKWVFDPALGNVAFVSGVDAWGFRIPQFAYRYAARFGLTPAETAQLLWHPHWISSKTGKVRTKPPKSSDADNEPLVVKLIFKPIWDAYDAMMYNPNPSEALKSIIETLGLTFPPRDLANLLAAKDWKFRAQTFFPRWLPVSECLLSMAVSDLPSPITAQRMRMERILPDAHALLTQAELAIRDILQRKQQSSGSLSDPIVPAVGSEEWREAEREYLKSLEQQCVDPRESEPESASPNETESEAKTTPEGELPTRIRYRSPAARNYALARAVQTCDRLSPESLVYVVKVVDMLTFQHRNPTTSAAKAGDSNTLVVGATGEVENNQSQAKPEHRYLAVARVFAGTLKSLADDDGDLTIVGPKDTKALMTVPKKKLQMHILMATDTEKVNEAPAGTVVGITGVDDIIYKFYTMVSSPTFPVFKPLTFQATPIFRVIVEPENAEDIRTFSRALAWLDKIDPNIQVGNTELGEYFIAASGELHIDRCLRDLRDVLGPSAPIRVSPPSVNFRETIVDGEGLSAGKFGLGYATDGAAASNIQRVVSAVSQASADKNPRDISIKLALDNGCAAFRIKAVPLPPAIANFLDQNRELIRGLRSRVVAARSQFRKRIHALLENEAYAVPSSDHSRATEGKPGSDLTIAEIQFFIKLRELFREHSAGLDENELKEEEKREKAHDQEVRTSWYRALCPRSLPSLKSLFATGDIVDYIWSFGPKHCGPNLLICRSAQLAYASSITAALGLPGSWEHANYILRYGSVSAALRANPIGESSESSKTDQSAELPTFIENPSYAPGMRTASSTAALQRLKSPPKDTGLDPRLRHALEHSAYFSKYADPNLDQGYQLATQNGPICGEMMMGVCFVVEQLRVSPYTSRLPDMHGSPAVQMIYMMREACHTIFTLKPRRLMEAMFNVELQCVADVLGRICGVVNRRRGRIISDTDLIEGTLFYNVRALLPVYNSFGFATDARKQTGGVTNPLLFFSHWEVINEDPFFVPTTEEELEEFGSEDRSHNYVKALITQIRKQKGLIVEEVAVAAPEKQRTLARKK